MKQRLSRALSRVVTRSAVGLALGWSIASAALAHDDRHYVYTQNNAQGDNRVLVFEQHANGALVNVSSFSTGGAGAGANLGSQGALALSQDGRWLFAVNAGSNSISVFDVYDEKLTLASTIGSGGTTPISVT